MSLQSWQEVLSAANIDGSALSNSTTPTSLLPSGARVSIPANFLKVGSVLRIDAAGRISNIVTSPGTLTLDFKIGSIIVATSGAINLNAVAKTNVPWVLEWVMTCRAIGGGTVANLMHQGMWTSEAVIGSPTPAAGSAGTAMLPNSAPAVGNGFDSTAGALIDLLATFSVANSGNSIQLHQFVLGALN